MTPSDIPYDIVISYLVSALPKSPNRFNVLIYTQRPKANLRVKHAQIYGTGPDRMLHQMDFTQINTGWKQRGIIMCGRHWFTFYINVLRMSRQFVNGCQIKVPSQNDEWNYINWPSIFSSPHGTVFLHHTLAMSTMLCYTVPTMFAVANDLREIRVGTKYKHWTGELCKDNVC